MPGWLRTVETGLSTAHAPRAADATDPAPHEGSPQTSATHVWLSSVRHEVTTLLASLVLSTRPVAQQLIREGFFFQAEDGIRDGRVTGVQTCALPIAGCGKREALVEIPARVNQLPYLELAEFPADDVSHPIVALELPFHQHEGRESHYLRVLLDHLLRDDDVDEPELILHQQEDSALRALRLLADGDEAGGLDPFAALQLE